MVTPALTCRLRDCCNPAAYVVTTERPQPVFANEGREIGRTIPQRIPLCESCAREMDGASRLVTAVRL